MNIHKYMLQSYIAVIIKMGSVLLSTGMKLRMFCGLSKLQILKLSFKAS